eukprot:scaffold7175_cov70-Skeletonema_dohrnii-CCMP3373.AAC.4
MDRTHCIMRIASTASPVSGADVRERIEEVRLMLKVENSVSLIARTWRKYSKGKKGRKSPISVVNEGRGEMIRFGIEYRN